MLPDGIDLCPQWAEKKKQMAETSNCPYQRRAVRLLRDIKERKAIKGEAGDSVEWVVSWFSIDIWPHVTQLSIIFLQSDTKAHGLLLVQGGGGASDAAASSQRSVEFDARPKSCPFLLKGCHWRGKQQTEFQCDCLSNEKITALHLTENDPQQKDWVNKKLLLQMGLWHAGACVDTWTANVSQLSCRVPKPRIIIQMLQSDAPEGAGGKCWIIMFIVCVHECVCIQDGDRFHCNGFGNNLDISHRRGHVPVLQHKWTFAVI